MSPPPVPTSAPSSRPLSARITDAWQQRGPLACALLPLSWVYAGLSAARSRLYQLGWLPSYRAPVPVIVIGNVIAPVFAPLGFGGLLDEHGADLESDRHADDEADEPGNEWTGHGWTRLSVSC